MKFSHLAICFLYLTALFAAGSAQSARADSDPVILGSTTYLMPQSAIDAEIGGKVTVAIRVDEAGAPTKAMMITGPMWPCGTTPTKAIDDLASSLSEMAMKLKFSPAIKDGKPVERDIGLTLDLKNPKLAPQPADIDPATGKPKAKLVSGGVLNGKAVHLPKPSYPLEARKNRDAGAVTVQILIDEEGKVIRAGAVSGAPTLQRASREAACSARFSPTLLVGNPVKVSGVITYNFIP